MPKKAVAVFFSLAFLGAAIFVFLTFPRTKEEIPKSNNQRPFPVPAPMPGSTVPPGAPVPETVPPPSAAKVPPGPTLRVMAWGSAAEAQGLEGQVDAFAAATGRRAALTIDGDVGTYRRDLAQAVASGSPPDVVLVSARDYSGLDPAHDLVDVTSLPESAPRSVAAFTVGTRVKAAPAEFTVEVLYYNRSYFDQAGLGYPGRHWTWDILEADARAIESLRLKDNAGHPIYPLELPADFDLWNTLSTQAGHPVLDQDAWHLADDDAREAQLRALDFVHEIFQGLSVTAPLPKAGSGAGGLFAQQRAALLIGSSELQATLPKFGYGLSLLPQDMERASLARVNGWAVTAQAADPGAARALADYLAARPIHAGWNSVRMPAATGDAADAICYEALGQALVPRIEPRAARLAQFLDAQIDLLARNGATKTDVLYARIQSAYQGIMPTAIPAGTEAKPTPKVGAVPQLRGD